MNLRYITAKMLVLTITSLTATIYRVKNEVREPSNDVSRATQIINTGISLNQHISSSSLNSGVSAATRGGQYVISKSGRYFLSTDVLAAPAASKVPCIYINSSDVVLDLGGRTLTLSTTTHQKNISAIEIAAGKSGITIMNGTLNGRAGTSSVYTTTGIMVNAGANNVLIDNVHVINFGDRGLVFDTGCADIILNRVHAYNNAVSAAVTARCMTLLSCNDVYIIDSTFNKTNSTNPNNTYGIYANECNSITLSNVQICNTTASSGYLRGLWLYKCTGAICNNVRILGTTSGGNAVNENIGFDIWGTKGSVFTNCIASNGSSTHYTSSTYGFKITNNASNNTFTNCVAKNNHGGGTSAGFKVSTSDGNLFQECSSIGNGGASHLTYGFLSGLTTSSGLISELTLSCSGNTYKQCTASGNTATVGHTFGFDMIGEIGSIIQNCEIKANTASGICYGIALHYDSEINIIEYNSIYSNKGVVGHYGFKDFSSDSTTFLRQNVSFGHGITFKGGNSNLIDTGFMNYMLSYSEAVGQMNMLSLIKESDIANMNAFEIGSPNWFNFSILHNSIAS